MGWRRHRRLIVRRLLNKSRSCIAGARDYASTPYRAVVIQDRGIRIEVEQGA